MFHFHAVGVGPFDYTVTVSPFSSPHSQTKTITGAQGGVLWAGNAAFEIPPGALPTGAPGTTSTP